MVDIANLSTAFTKFAQDFSQFQTDLSAFLQTIATDPATQAKIDGFTDQLTSMDTAVKRMDESLRPTTQTT